MDDAQFDTRSCCKKNEVHVRPVEELREGDAQLRTRLHSGNGTTVRKRRTTEERVQDLCSQREVRECERATQELRIGKVRLGELTILPYFGAQADVFQFDGDVSAPWLERLWYRGHGSHSCCQYTVLLPGCGILRRARENVQEYDQLHYICEVPPNPAA